MYAIAAVVIAVVLGLGAYEYFGRQAPTPSGPGPSAQMEATKPAVVGLPAASDLLPHAFLGRADAPVTIVEFSSLTCGHCGNFHRETLPKIKAAYIDTGKARLLYRDFPLDKLALVAAMLPHCAASDQYFGLLDVLFRTQEAWATSQDPLNELAKVVRLGGMSKEAFEACINNEKLFAAIQERSRSDQQRYGVDSTPTFAVNGVMVTGALPFDEFSKVIDDALKKAK